MLQLGTQSKNLRFRIEKIKEKSDDLLDGRSIQNPALLPRGFGCSSSRNERLHICCSKVHSSAAFGYTWPFQSARGLAHSKTQASHSHSSLLPVSMDATPCNPMQGISGKKRLFIFWRVALPAIRSYSCLAQVSAFNVGRWLFDVLWNLDVEVWSFPLLPPVQNIPRRLSHLELSLFSAIIPV
jgi:hypothetical protein